MIRTRSLMSAAPLAGVALSFLPLSANAQVPSYSQPPVQRPTFAAAVNGLAVPATGAMDAVCISGSATKIVRVKRIVVTGVQATTAGTSDVELFFRTAANSGGTSTSPTVMPLDSNNAAGTAVVKAYTVAPTSGAGTAVRSQKLPVPLASSAGQYPPIVWDFTPTSLSQEVVLRGVAQQACVNFPAAFAGTAPAIDIDVTWTE